MNVSDRVLMHRLNRMPLVDTAEIFDDLNQELLRLGLLSREMYVDSTLVKANVSGYGLAHSRITFDGFKEQAIEENGLFMPREPTPVLLLPDFPVSESVFAMRVVASRCQQFRLRL